MNRELMEFQDAKLTQRVAARYQASTATPIFDELYRGSSKITPSLARLADQLGKVSDKVHKSSKDSEVLSLSRQALDLAYKVFEPFRPMLTNAGGSEISNLKTLSGTQVGRAATGLHEVVSRDLSQKYNAVAQAIQDGSLERAKDAVEALALEAAHVKNFYTQYVRAYAG